MPGICRARRLWITIPLIVAEGRAGFPRPSAATRRAARAPPRRQARPPCRDGLASDAAPVGSWSGLPARPCLRRPGCTARPGSRGDERRRPNHHLATARRVTRRLAARPVAVDHSYDQRWDSWLLPRVTGHYTGHDRRDPPVGGLQVGHRRQPAARDRGARVHLVPVRRLPVRPLRHRLRLRRLSTHATPATRTFCAAIAGRATTTRPTTAVRPLPARPSGSSASCHGRTRAGAGCADNQNGTFPFNRNSTAFALDYLGRAAARLLRGLGAVAGQHRDRASTPAAGLWGCVGAWYSGDWRSPAADGYIARVRARAGTAHLAHRRLRSGATAVRPTVRLRRVQTTEGTARQFQRVSRQSRCDSRAAGFGRCFNALIGRPDAFATRALAPAEKRGGSEMTSISLSVRRAAITAFTIVALVGLSLLGIPSAQAAHRPGGGLVGVQRRAHVAVPVRPARPPRPRRQRLVLRGQQLGGDDRRQVHAQLAAGRPLPGRATRSAAWARTTRT